MANSIVLIGMMGAGKTTTGQAVAERLGWEFLDSDRQVEARTGRTVADIWREQGERGFRELETDALAAALAGTVDRPAVIAAAGGVVLNPRNRALLEAHPPVVWLRARPDTLAARVVGGTHRPLLDVDPAAALVRLDEERRPFYEALAHTVIDVDDLAPEEVVDRVVNLAFNSRKGYLHGPIPRSKAEGGR
ncbi:MAG: shikimate kinase [Acidimicrobiales bacterium]